MAHFDNTVESMDFPLRRDRKGVHVVYKLGNELGPCPFSCTFCGVGNSPRVEPEENRARFDRIFAKYASRINEPYHAAIFNEGNITHAREFSRETLQHVLNTFASDSNVQYLSLNSREGTATTETLTNLRDLGTPFPIHFIFGLETLSARGRTLLGKSNEGELERFLAKLSPFNRVVSSGGARKPYVFGLDINMVFLPEIHLDPGEERRGREQKIHNGVLGEFRSLLSRLDPTVPCQINIHPYYEVPSLPFRNADLLHLLRILPDLQSVLDDHNEKHKGPRTDLFVGVVFFDSEKVGEPPNGLKSRIERLITQFNATGRLSGNASVAASPATWSK